MKHQIYNFSACVCLFITLFSCQKQPDSATTPTPTPTPNPTVTPLLYPKTIHFITPPISRGTDDITHTFEYNSQNKLVKLTDVSGQSNSTNRIVEFIYDASNKLSEIRTHGSPYFTVPKPVTLQSPFALQKVVYSGQRVDIRKDTISDYSIASSYMLFDQKGFITRHYEKYFGEKTYDLNVSADGKVSSYTYNDTNGTSGAITTPTNSGTITYTTVPSPFTNTPELRLFSLIKEQRDYYRLTEDILLTNMFCPSLVTGGNFFDRTLYNNPTSTEYIHTLNTYGYPTTIKSVCNGKVVRQIDITYEMR